MPLILKFRHAARMCQKVHTVERDNPQHAKRITWAVQEQKAAATEY